MVILAVLLFRQFRRTASVSASSPNCSGELLPRLSLSASALYPLSLIHPYSIVKLLIAGICGLVAMAFMTIIVFPRPRCDGVAQEEEVGVRHANPL